VKPERIQAVTLVTVQLGMVAALLLSGPVLPSHPLWRCTAVLSALLGVWAVWSMGLRQLRIGPGMAADARLVTRGPYRLIRHPMYSALLLFTLSLALDHPRWPRAVMWAALLVCLLAKLRLEEQLVARRHPEYAAYRQRTKRLIPFVY
jgi:protein-S-isoprenylcysteine O-methyltransferase Ste14